MQASAVPLQGERSRPVSFTAKADCDDSGNEKGNAGRKWRAMPVSVKGTRSGPGWGDTGASQLQARDGV